MAVANELSGSTTLYEIETPGVEKTGTDGDDLLDGSSGDDTIIGLAGNDTINGLSGDDALYGDGEVAADCVAVRFVSEEAGYRSTYGWYDTETLEAGILVANVDTVTNPDVENFTAGLAVPPDELDTLGFFLIPDGYGQNPARCNFLRLAIRRTWIWRCSRTAMRGRSAIRTRAMCSRARAARPISPIRA